MEGLVLKSMGSWYSVLLKDDTKVNCKIRGKFRIKGLKLTNPVAVGDLVEVEIKGEQDIPVIVEIKKRNNYIVRKSVNLSKQYHVLASNVDQAVLLVTIDSPFTSFEFIDRFLVTAEAYHIPVVIVVNKLDLYGEEELEKVAELMMIYEELGYQVLVASVLKNKGVGKVNSVLKDKTTVIVGHSGVGKSSLLNELAPEYDLKTSEISEMHNQGVHTTTFAEMYFLPEGGRVIDTPGIKGLGIVDIEKAELGNYFTEILKFGEGCHFNNCVHVKEPKCAVKKAVEEEEISAWRYRSYLSMFNEEEENLYR